MAVLIFFPSYGHLSLGNQGLSLRQDVKHNKKTKGTDIRLLIILQANSCQIQL